MQSDLASVVLCLLLGQTIGARPSEIYREEFKLQPETARISEEFYREAWIAILYASRLDSTDLANSSGDRRIDNELEVLRTKVKTDGEWLFWFRLKDYSRINADSSDQIVVSGERDMPDANGCRSALMVALRARVLTATMPDCEADQRSSPKRKP